MGSQSALAYQQIKEMIFHIEFRPGEHISETQIAAKLSISRTPIHDALQKLSAEGLVRIARNRGAVVTKFSDEEIREIGTIRLMQDILSIQLAAYYGCASDFEHLLRLAGACETAAAAGDVYGRIQKDIELHMAIARMSKNAHLISQQFALYQQIHLIQISKYTDVEHSLVQIHLHRPLIDAIRRGSLCEAKRLICQHAMDFYKIDPYILKCYGGEDIL